MFKFLQTLYVAVVQFVKRLVTVTPRNPYERIVFDAVYTIGGQLQKGVVV